MPNGLQPAPTNGEPVQYATARAEGKAGSGFYASLVVLAGVMAFALYAWIVQVQEGLDVTGLNAYVTWGVYIVNFVFFIGLSAGGIIVASLVNVFSWERYKSVARLAELVAFVCLGLAALSILMSMGRPDRVWTLFIYSNWGSPLMWDVFVVFTYMVLTLAMLYFGIRADLVRRAARGKGVAWLYRLLSLGRNDLSPAALATDRRWLRGLSAVAIPYAIVLHSVTAWIIGLVKARPAWFSTLLAPLFVVSALASGLALLLSVAILAKWLLKANIPERTIQGLAKILLFCVPVLGYFLFAELITVMFGGVPDEAIFFEDMMFGQYAWLFWFDLVGGIVLPFIVLAWPRLRRNEGAVLIASTLVVLGVYAERFNLVVVPQFHKLLPHTHGSYTPTWVEMTLTAGVVAALALAVMVFSKLVPLAEPEVGHAREPAR